MMPCREVRRTSAPASHSLHDLDRGSLHHRSGANKEMRSMSGRTILNLALGAIVVLVLAGIGIGIYNAGVSQGIAQAATLPEGTTVVAPATYGYGYGHPGFLGFGFLWILFPIFFFLLLFGLARAAFGGGRGWGPGGGSGPNGWHEERERRMAEYHQRLHDEVARGSGDAGRPNPPSAV